MKYVYKHIIFDLDGTLSDSREGIFNAYNYAILKLNLKSPDHGKFQTLIGPPLQKGFTDVFGLHGPANEDAVKAFREYYEAKGLYENKLYEGIKPLLEDIVMAGPLLYLATAKYIRFAEKVLEYFDIEHLFTEIAGADYEGRHAGKLELIGGILRRNGIHNPDEVIVVGDTRFDIEAAGELGIDSVGISCGFTSHEEMITFDPDYIAQSVDELREILLER